MTTPSNTRTIFGDFLPDSNTQHGAILEDARRRRNTNRREHAARCHASFAEVHPERLHKPVARRVSEVAAELTHEANTDSIDNPVMQIVRQLNGTKMGQCVGLRCGKMLTSLDKDHALCNVCWDKMAAASDKGPSSIELELAAQRIAYEDAMVAADRARAAAWRVCAETGVPPALDAMPPLDAGGEATVGSPKQAVHVGTGVPPRPRAPAPPAEDSDEEDLIREMRLLNEQLRPTAADRRWAYEEACLREGGARFLFSPKPVARRLPICRGYIIEHHSIKNGKDVVVFAWEEASLERAKASARQELGAFRTNQDYYQICRIIDDDGGVISVWAGNSDASLM